MKAKPTEYRGVRYDSKSEAIFARLLDLSDGYLSREHPISAGGHQWDFLFWATGAPDIVEISSGNSQELQQFYGPEMPTPWLIEYKPIKPTESYIDSIKRIGESLAPCIQCALVWGSAYEPLSEPWNGIYAHFVGMELRPGTPSIIPIETMFYADFDDLDALIDMSKSYRYDLDPDRPEICRQNVNEKSKGKGILSSILCQ